VTAEPYDDDDDDDHWNLVAPSPDLPDQKEDHWNLVDDGIDDDRFNVIAPGKRFHPAMRRQRDPTIDPRTIIPTRRVLREQERLRAEAAEQVRRSAHAAYGPGWDIVEVLSKSEARVGGTLVTLDTATGVLTCPMHRGHNDCWHIQRLREVALKRRH
jgi:hypothetical protein